MIVEDGEPVCCNCTPQGWIVKNAILQGPYWPEPISVVTYFQSSHGFVTVEAVGSDTRRQRRRPDDFRVPHPGAQDAGPRSDPGYP
jgi:hypothetical protein